MVGRVGFFVNDVFEDFCDPITEAMEERNAAVGFGVHYSAVARVLH